MNKYIHYQIPIPWLDRLVNRWRSFAKRRDFQSLGTLGRRQYANYTQYVAHQQSKLGVQEDRIRELSQRKHREERFVEKFRPLIEEFGMSGAVLCLGARLGEEVRAFRTCVLRAIGVDLNPGTNNPDVQYADFHRLPFPDNHFDVAYSNVLDHVFDLDKFLKEATRVVKPDGWIWLELGGGYEETGAVDNWGALLWARNDDLVRAMQPYMAKLILNRSDAATRRIVMFRPKKEAK